MLLLWNPYFVSHLKSSSAAATQRTNHHDLRKHFSNTLMPKRLKVNHLQLNMQNSAVVSSGHSLGKLL